MLFFLCITSLSSEGLVFTIWKFVLKRLALIFFLSPCFLSSFILLLEECVCGAHLASLTLNCESDSWKRRQKTDTWGKGWAEFSENTSFSNCNGQSWGKVLVTWPQAICHKKVIFKKNIYRVSYKKQPFVPLLMVQKVFFCGTPCIFNCLYCLDSLDM